MDTQISHYAILAGVKMTLDIIDALHLTAEGRRMDCSAPPEGSAVVHRSTVGFLEGWSGVPSVRGTRPDATPEEHARRQADLEAAWLGTPIDWRLPEDR